MKKLKLTPPSVWRTRAGVLALASLAALILCSIFATRARIANAAGIEGKLIGDTLSLVNLGAQPDTLLESTYDCCLMSVSTLSDTTRPFEVIGAKMAGFRFIGKDTAGAFRFHITGLQVSNDSTNWAALTFGSSPNTDYSASFDTVAVTLAVAWTRVGTAGWSREARFYPTNDFDATGGGLERHGSDVHSRFTFRWVRLILTRSLLAPAGPGTPHPVRVDAWAIRDDIGEAMRRRKWGP